jgi:NitT/TauT family transport system permease protein
MSVRVAERVGEARPRRAKRPELLRIVRPLGFLVGLLVVWQLVTALGRVEAYLLPAPSLIVEAIWADLRSGALLNNGGVTLYEAVLGFVLGSLAGFVLGVLISQSRALEDTIYPFIVALQAMPRVALAPLLIVWLGFGAESKVVIAALLAMFPLLVSVIVGLKSVEPERLELMAALAASRWQTLWMVRLPGALPVIFAGLEVGMVFSVVGATVGELSGAKAGLMYLIQYRSFSMDTPGIFSALVALSLMGLALATLIRALGRRVVFWQARENPAGV